MVTKKGFTQFVGFRTPGEVIFVPTCGRIRHKVRMHFFFQNLLIYILSTWESYFSYGPYPNSGKTKGPCLLCTHFCLLLCFFVFGFNLDYEIDSALLSLPFHKKNIALKT